MYGVADLDAATARLRDQVGIEARGGGVHPTGTKNRAIRCRDDSYVELIAVNDASLPLGRWLQRQIADGDRLVGWAVRVDDIDAVVDRLEVEVTPGSIDMPDGTTNTWRMAGVAALAADASLPFFIEYDRSSSARTSADLPPDAPERILWVAVAGDAGRLREWLGGVDLDVRVVDGDPGVRAVGLETAAGEAVIR
jgi:hypothetical protein